MVDNNAHKPQGHATTREERLADKAERLAREAEQKAKDDEFLKTPDPKHITLVQNIVAKLTDIHNAAPQDTSLTLTFDSPGARAGFARVMHTISTHIQHTQRTPEGSEPAVINFGTHSDTYVGSGASLRTSKNLTINSQDLGAALDTLQHYVANESNHRTLDQSVGPESSVIGKFSVAAEISNGRI